MRAALIAAICLCALPAFAAESIDNLIALSDRQAENKQFYPALQTLDKAARKDPENYAVKLEIARVYSYQGRYDDAERELGILADANPSNLDVKRAQAHLDFYRGRFAEAAKEFRALLLIRANDAESADGLKLAEDAEKDSAGFVWQLDSGYERSNFARKPSTPWNNEFIQLARSFDQGDTSVHARFEYYDQYENNDTYYELGADHRFAPWLNAYLYGGHTVDASFHPRWRVEPGGNLRVVEENQSQPAVWLTFDAKEDDYGQISVATFDPGMRFESGDWALSPNLVIVKQWGIAPLVGGNIRLDGPVSDALRFYLGYAYAPETEDAVSVYTASIYGGFAYDADDAHTVYLGYTRDDRQNSWIRNAASVALTYRY